MNRNPSGRWSEIWSSSEDGEQEEEKEEEKEEEDEEEKEEREEVILWGQWKVWKWMGWQQVAWLCPCPSVLLLIFLPWGSSALQDLVSADNEVFATQIAPAVQRAAGAIFPPFQPWMRLLFPGPVDALCIRAAGNWQPLSQRLLEKQWC